MDIKRHQYYDSVDDQSLRHIVPQSSEPTGYPSLFYNTELRFENIFMMEPIRAGPKQLHPRCHGAKPNRRL